ncbi:hypothetical protein SCT_2644 [Sulfuricella sp. T08]|uniref:hypothetical protein n=1 Tax=Sulfuricella sp. T08 TaxID=1632857 RepID=UPI000617997E|nr:hypothetical protein [Sulfuricella sp. T08]GAO37226.1 hypothetical protein SCT_2644 [Sulfuricella sp. T08]
MNKYNIYDIQSGKWLAGRATFKGATHRAQKLANMTGTKKLVTHRDQRYEVNPNRGFEKTA